VCICDLDVEVRDQKKPVWHLDVEVNDQKFSLGDPKLLSPTPICYPRTAIFASGANLWLGKELFSRAPLYRSAFVCVLQTTPSS
jgi:hypothetical protein